MLSACIQLSKEAVEMKASKTYQYGNSKVKIVSPFVDMTKEQQGEWFESEWEKGNPILHEIVDAAMDCLTNEEDEVG